MVDAAITSWLLMTVPLEFEGIEGTDDRRTRHDEHQMRMAVEKMQQVRDAQSNTSRRRVNNGLMEIAKLIVRMMHTD